MKLFALKQSLNWKGVQALALLFTKPKLLFPTLYLPSIANIDFKDLKSKGINYLVFDKDNTLTYTYNDELSPVIQSKLQEATEYFDIAVLSNSVGSNDDVDYKLAEEFEQTSKLPVIRHKLKKPACMQEVIEHFQKSHSKCEEGLPSNGRPHRKVEACQICMIGDRVLTDVVFANQHNMMSILVKPLSYIKDHPIAVIFRLLEVKVMLPILSWIVFRKPFRLSRNK